MGAWEGGDAQMLQAELAKARVVQLQQKQLASGQERSHCGLDPESPLWVLGVDPVMFRVASKITGIWLNMRNEAQTRMIPADIFTWTVDSAARGRASCSGEKDPG